MIAIRSFLYRFLRLCKKLSFPIKFDIRYYEIETKEGVNDIRVPIMVKVDKHEYWNKVVYRAYIEGVVAHHSTIYKFTPFLVQSGKGFIATIGDSYTEPKFRGMKIFPFVLSYILNDVKGKPRYHKVAIMVSHENSASIQGIERVGFIHKADIVGQRYGTLIISKVIDTTMRGAV